LERPQQHETDSAGERLLKSALEPVGWAVNKIEHDYGIDFDVQIFRDHQATGEWFKIQLKSSESTAYSADRSFVSERLDVKHAKHFACEIREPVFVIHSDVRNEKVFWHSPQLDKALKTKLSQSHREEDSDVTIRIPTEHSLPLGLPGLLTALEQIQIVLGAAFVMNAPAAQFVDVITDQGEGERCIRDFQNRIDALRLGNVDALFRQGSLQKAAELVHQILQSNESSIESKFAAELQDERIRIRQYRTSGLPQTEFHRICLDTGLRLRALTKNGPPALKLFSLIAVKAGELDVLTFRDVGLFMNWKVHVERSDPPMALGSYIELARSSRLITRKYNQCLRLANYAAKSVHLWALPRALIRIVQGLAVFFIHLKNEKQPDVFSAYFQSAIRLCRLAASAAERDNDESGLSAVATMAMLLYESGPADVEALVDEVLAKIQDPEVKKQTEAVVERNLRRSGGEHVEGDTPATLAQAVENMAAAIGINLLDGSDPATALVQIGVKDMNPGRSLVHCQRTFVSVGRPPNEMAWHLARALKLPSIGSKILHCDLHGYAIEGPSLDPICEAFKSQYCRSCADRSPRASDWEYSDAWQQEENRRHVDFMAKFLAQRKWGS